MVKKKQIFKVIFTSQGKVYEIYARSVDSSVMQGFVAVEEILFGERTTLVVDPTEEQLKLEFAGVTRIHIPFHAVVNRRGRAGGRREDATVCSTWRCGSHPSLDAVQTRWGTGEGVTGTARRIGGAPVPGTLPVPSRHT